MIVLLKLTADLIGFYIDPWLIDWLIRFIHSFIDRSIDLSIDWLMGVYLKVKSIDRLIDWLICCIFPISVNCIPAGSVTGAETLVPFRCSRCYRPLRSFWQGTPPSHITHLLEEQISVLPWARMSIRGSFPREPLLTTLTLSCPKPGIWPKSTGNFAMYSKRYMSMVSLLLSFLTHCTISCPNYFLELFSFFFIFFFIILNVLFSRIIFSNFSFFFSLFWMFYFLWLFSLIFHFFSHYFECFIFSDHFFIIFSNYFWLFFVVKFHLDPLVWRIFVTSKFQSTFSREQSTKICSRLPDASVDRPLCTCRKPERGIARPLCTCRKPERGIADVPLDLQNHFLKKEKRFWSRTLSNILWMVEHTRVTRKPLTPPLLFPNKNEKFIHQKWASIILRCSLWRSNPSWDRLNQYQKKGKNQLWKGPQRHPYTMINFPTN